MAATAGPSLPSAAPTATPAPTPIPSPTPHIYVVQAGDSLSEIAARFGLTVEQLLTANPQIGDPDRIRAGDELIIPPPDAPSGLPRSARILDPTGDLVDAEDAPTFAPGYVDLVALGARVERDVIVVEVRGVSTPPEADPDVETVSYSVHIDTTRDGRPDARLDLANAPGAESYVPTFTDLISGEQRTGVAFPGVVEIADDVVRFQVDRDALGGSRRYAVAAALERRFFPGGAGDPGTEIAIDRVPDQQWPHVNAVWLEVGIGG